MGDGPRDEPAEIAGLEIARHGAALLQNLENSLDLDGGVQRQLRHADRETRMLAVFSKDRGDEIGGAVDHLRQLLEIRRAVDIAAEPHRRRRERSPTAAFACARTFSAARRAAAWPASSETPAPSLPLWAGSTTPPETGNWPETNNRWPAREKGT